MTAALIWARYRVPARRGMTVNVAGQQGRIVGFTARYLLVRFDHRPRPVPVHPTLEVTYPRTKPRR